MRRLHRIGLALLLSVATCGAHAIGGSGGCSGGAPFGRALTHGTPVELEQKILDWINRGQPPPGLFESIGNALRGDEGKQKARQQAIKDIIEGTSKASVCSSGALLHYAVQAGNIPVMNYLLDAPLGVDVDVPKGILFGCEHEQSMSEDQRERRRTAFEMLIDKGLADVNALRDGKSLLQVCHAPELVALFVEKGARVDIERSRNERPINVLEESLIDAVMYAEDTYTSRRLQGLARARIFAKALGASIRGRAAEASIKTYCNRMPGRNPWNPQTCLELSTFITASPGVWRAPVVGEAGYIDDGTLLHVIGARDGSGPPGAGEQEVTVRVDDDSAAMVLALTTQKQTHWRVVLKAGVRLQKVILASYYAQRVSGIPETVPIEVYTYEPSPCGQCFWGAGYFHSLEYAPAELKRMTGLEVTSFQREKHRGEFWIPEGFRSPR